MHSGGGVEWRLGLSTIRDAQEELIEMLNAEMGRVTLQVSEGRGYPWGLTASIRSGRAPER